MSTDLTPKNNSAEIENPTLNKNSTLERDFLAIKEIFQIDEVGAIRLSKLMPEHADNDEIFYEEFKRQIDFYKIFLGVDIKVNITENELFAGYKKVSIDIDGKHNMQVWNHILKNILPDLEKDGFKKSFISLEVLKDLPKEILDDYMKLVSADFVLESGNIIKDIVLWLENALATKYSKEKGLGDISDIIKGNNDLEHLMMMIAHVSKMDNEFKETLELLYIKLVRYKDPKVQGLLRFLGHNVDKNVSEKKLIDKARSKFSIGISRVLGSFGGAKKALPNPSKGGEMDWTSSQISVSPEMNLLNNNSFTKLPSSFINKHSIDLSTIFIGHKILKIEIKSEYGFMKNDRLIGINGNIITLRGQFSHGDYEIFIDLENGEKYILKLHIDPNYTKNTMDFSDVMIKKDEKIQNPHLPVVKKVNEILKLDKFDGIETLEEIFLNRKNLDLKAVFNGNISAFLSGKIFFDKDGFLFLEGNLHLQTIIENSDFGILVRGLLDGNFDEGKAFLEKEKLTFAEFLDFVRETQEKLSHFLENDTKNGIAKLCLENVEIFKNDESKRKMLLEIIKSKKQEFNSDFIDIYRELAKTDKKFRKIYVLSSIEKIEKVQVLKILLERNNLAIIDVWEYLTPDIIKKFFSPLDELFDYNIEENRFNELLIGFKKELKYLFGEDIQSILNIFEGLYGDDNYLSLKVDISELDTSNIIMKSLINYMTLCVYDREYQIENTIKKIEERKNKFLEFLNDTKNSIFNFDYKLDEYGYVTGSLNIQITEQSKYTQNVYSRLGFILQGKTTEKLFFESVNPEQLQELINAWEDYKLFKENYLDEDDIIKLINQSFDKLTPYLDDVNKILTTYKYRDEIFGNPEFARKLLNRLSNLGDRFKKELVFFELIHTQSLSDIIDLKKKGLNIIKEDFDRYFSKELQKKVNESLLKYIKSKDEKNLAYCLQLDDNTEEFLKELLELDLKNKHELSKFTSKYRNTGIIISKICVIIDNLIASIQETRVKDNYNNDKYIDKNEYYNDKIIKNTK